jgi:hypothetical protein
MKRSFVMKKRQKVMMTVAIVLIAAVMGCASGGGANQRAGNSDVPDWYLVPPEDPGYLYGIGSAKMENMDRSQRAAEHRARNSLAFQLTAYVKAMEVDYGKSAGTTSDKAAADLFENIDRQLAAAALSGASVSKRYIAKDGRQYALITYPKNSAKDAVKGVISNAASREATVQAGLALSSMDKAFAELSVPTPVETGE